MPVSIQQIHPVFAGEVSGVDCARPLSQDEVAAIEAGMDQYAVLVLRDEILTDQQQIDFTRQFGELEGYNTPGHIRKREESRLGAGIADFSNLDKSGAIMSDQDLPPGPWPGAPRWKSGPEEGERPRRRRIPTCAGPRAP